MLLNIRVTQKLQFRTTNFFHTFVSRVPNVTTATHQRTQEVVQT